MRYLTKVTETYRITSEAEVATFLEALKADTRFEIATYKSTKKTIKEKGEIVDEYIKFEITKIFNDEKYPDSDISVEYVNEGNY